MFILQVYNIEKKKQKQKTTKETKKKDVNIIIMSTTVAIEKPMNDT